MSGLEIERKFLVRNNDYKRLATSSSRICQGYICSSRGRTVRVRIRDGRGYLTIKGPSGIDGLTRYEFEKEISLDEAQHTFEVDEFYGENEGLVMAEVELESEDEAYEKPDFIGIEVTGDRRYYNSCLLKNPFTSWDENTKTTPQEQQQV